MSLLTELVSDVGDADGTVVDGLTLVFGLNCPQKESYCSFSPGVSSNGTNLSFLVTVAVALGAGAETLALDTAAALDTAGVACGGCDASFGGGGGDFAGGALAKLALRDSLIAIFFSHTSKAQRSLKHVSGAPNL